VATPVFPATAVGTAGAAVVNVTSVATADADVANVTA